MGELPRHVQTLGLIFSTFLLLATLLLGAFALWEWWYIAQLPPNEAMAIGTAVRLAPAVITGVVFFLEIGTLLLVLGRAMALRVIRSYRWRFCGAFLVMFGIIYVAFQVLQLGTF
jgi:hypothetical protein